MSVSTTKLDLRHDNNGIYATIETDNLFLRPIEDADVANCFTLYSNPVVMEKFHNGQTRDFAYTADRVNTLAKRWLEGDPFSGFAVFIKEKGGHEQFAGLIVLGHGDRPGEAELAGLGDVQFWNKGYGKEATKALLDVYVPRLAADEYPVGHTETEDGQPLRKIVATCRVDNIASNMILTNIGMQHYKAEVTHGALRNHYEYNLPQKSRSWCVLL